MQISTSMPRRVVFQITCYGDGFGPAALPAGSPPAKPPDPEVPAAASACGVEALVLWYALVLISAKIFFNSCVLALTVSMLLLVMASRISCVALFTFST